MLSLASGCAGFTGWRRTGTGKTEVEQGASCRKRTRRRRSRNGFQSRRKATRWGLSEVGDDDRTLLTGRCGGWGLAWGVCDAVPRGMGLQRVNLQQGQGDDRPCPGLERSDILARILYGEAPATTPGTAPSVNPSATRHDIAITAAPLRMGSSALGSPPSQPSAPLAGGWTTAPVERFTGRHHGGSLWRI